MVMTTSIDEYDLREMPIRERLDRCKEILRREKDESLRWDAVWITGEIAEKEGRGSPLFDEAADVMTWVLKNDDNGVVKHEACYQIAMRKMTEKIPDLLNSALHDDSGLVKHEAIEALGLLDAFDSEELISKTINHRNTDVRQTTAFVLRRQERVKNKQTVKA
jgi:HEAT repeat protein